MAEIDPVSQTGCVRLRLKAAAPSSGRQSAVFAGSAPFTSYLVKGRWGFDVSLLPGFRGLGAGDLIAEAQQEAGASIRFRMFQRASLEGDRGVRVTQGVTNRRFALDCLSTRPVPSASQDVRAGFLFGGSW